MRLDVESPSPFVPPSALNTNTPFAADSSNARDYLNSGIRAAQSGDRTTARAMLLRSSELEPSDLNVWLWLASISEYPEELMGFVDRALEIDPYNDRALQWRTATCSLLAKTFIQRGSDAADSDQPMYAEDCFQKALEYDPKNTSAMMWLASLSKDPESRTGYLQRVIDLEPEHEAANNALRNIAVEEEKAEFALIRQAAANGDVESAVSLLGEFTNRYASNAEAWMLLSHLTVEPAGKIAALQSVLDLEPENQLAKASLDSLSTIFGEKSVVVEPAVAVDQSTNGDDEVAAISNDEHEEPPIAEPSDALVFASVEPEVAEIPQTTVVEDTPELETSNWQVEAKEVENDWDRQTETYAAEDLAVAEPVSDVGDVKADSFDESSSIPMPADALIAEEILPDRTGFETVVEAKVDSVSADVKCSFCSASNDECAFVCRSCNAVLTLSDLESLISNKNADTYMIRKAVDSMESERSSREFNEAELTSLGIGHLNLRNLQYGYDRLLEASRLNPNNVVLSSQLNSLLIRMDEIRRQEEVHAAMATGKKILVVDDSPTIQKLIAGKLEKCGHEVFLSNDGLDALEQIKTLTPDLVLLDITMPNMDGYEACRQIRGRVSTAKVPVVMISGKDGFFDKMRGRMAGAAGHITKPFGPETLMKAIEFYLGGGTDADVEQQEIEAVQ